MAGTRSGPRAPRPLYRRKPSRGTVGRGGRKTGTELMWPRRLPGPFRPSLIRGRLGELACLHALRFPHFVFCGDRGSHSSHPLSKKHGGFIQNAKKKRGKNGAVAMGWVVLKFATRTRDCSGRSKIKQKTVSPGTSDALENEITFVAKHDNVLELACTCSTLCYFSCTL